MKLIWDTPQLISLIRAKPEEAVLTSCKLSSHENACRSPATVWRTTSSAGVTSPLTSGVRADPVLCSQCLALTAS